MVRYYPLPGPQMEVVYLQKDICSFNNPHSGEDVDYLQQMAAKKLQISAQKQK